MDFQYTGDMVQCPFCVSLQIVPDPMLPAGTNYNGYVIVTTLASTVLWTTYEVARQPHNAALCIPTTFFLKRLYDLSGFADVVTISGSLNKPELPTLLNHSLTISNIYFVFEYQQEAHKMKNFIKEKPLDFNNALIVVRKIAVALSIAWEESGMLHQCLVPENISITNELNIRIKNIGLSAYLLQDQLLLEYGFNMWDYKYISPEFMTEGVANSPACDIYSLGGILFLLCTGHEPHAHTPPANIPSTPVPLLTNYLQEVPENLLLLFQMMMAPNPESRFASWNEVIRHIDTILSNQVAATTQIYYDNAIPATQTSFHEPVGLSAGDLTQAISKNAVTQSGQTPIISKTSVKPISKNNLTTMNKKWGHTKSKTSPRKKQPPHQPTPAPIPKNNNTNSVIVFSIVGTIGLIVILIIFLNAQKKKKPRRKTNYSRTEIKKQDAYASQKALFIKQGGRVAPSTSAIPPQPEITIKKRRLSPVKKSSSRLNTKLLAIDEFHLNNPDKNNEVLKRYEALITEAVEKKKFSLIDRIQAKINLLPDSPESIPTFPDTTIPNNPMDQKIETVIGVIKRQILPLLKEEKFDEALTILREYDGDLADESRKKRMDLALDIESRIARMQPEEKDSPSIDLDRQPAEKEKTPTEILKETVEKFAPSLFKGKFLDTKVKLELALKTTDKEIIKEQLTSWLTQINSYEKLQPELEKHDTANPVISAPENLEIMEKAFLLQGLLYKNKEQFVQAKQAFMKIPLNLGDIFVAHMEQSMAEE